MEKNIKIMKDGIVIYNPTSNRYEQTRRRVTKFHNNYNMSDREIIECLAEEIEQYRERIKNYQINKDIYTDRKTYHCGVDGGQGKDFTVVRWYEDGVLIKEEIKEN